MSPISVVTALRQSRKGVWWEELHKYFLIIIFFEGKLSYDRHWTERNSSVERVLNEVTEKIETIVVSSEKENKTDQTETKSFDETTSSTPKSALSKKFLEDRMRDSLTVLSPLSHDKSRSSLTNSPGLLSPVFVSLNRTEERDIVDPRNIIMSSESSIRSEQSINASLSISQSFQAEDDPLNVSSFSYPTSDLIKYDKFPRVDVEKLRLPPSMFVGSQESHNESEEIREGSSPDVAQAEVEEELVRYELERREEAERKVAERKAKWEQKAREKEEELKDQLEKIKTKLAQTERSSRARPAIDIEKEIEERLKIQLEEREERQKTLILLAKKEEQLAKEKQERKIRIGKQMERLAPLDTQINTNLTRLMDLWNNQPDKSLLSEHLTSSVPKLIQNCNVIEEARKKVVVGDCGPEMFDKLTELDGNIKATTGKIEEELERILAARKEEQEKADQQKKLEEQKAAEEKVKQQQQSQQQQQQSEPTQPVQAAQAAPQTTVAGTVLAIPAVKTPAGSPDNKTWYDEMIQFKSEYIKNIVFTDQEKTFKFELQKAVNTPLNSLSGVSSAHLQDKVDKLVSLLSGGQVSQGGKTFSVNQHPHAKGFCMALAAKKLANQGEQIVTSDHRLAFPAATFALAIWDKFPEFGNLLVANILVRCPFLAPHHPQQTAGQSDRDYYTVLGYTYEKDVIEPHDKYLKRMSGLARLYAALSISHLPKTSSSSGHPQPPSRLWSWLSSVLHLAPHTDVTATLMLDILEVAGHTMFNNYGKQFGKLLGFIKTKYFSQLEAVKSEGGPTVRLEQFLATAIRGGSIKEPDGLLKPGFL